MRTKCPHCKQVYEVDESYAGVNVTCQQCNTTFTIPPVVDNNHVILRTCPHWLDTIVLAAILMAAILPAVALYILLSGITESYTHWLPLASGLGCLIILPIIICSLCKALSKKTVYTLYPNRLEVVSGWLTQTVRTINVRDIQDITATQSIVQACVKTGDLICMTKGTQVPFIVVNIHDYMFWKMEIEKIMR